MFSTANSMAAITSGSTDLKAASKSALVAGDLVGLHRRFVELIGKARQCHIALGRDGLDDRANALKEGAKIGLAALQQIGAGVRR